MISITGKDIGILQKIKSNGGPLSPPFAYIDAVIVGEGFIRKDDRGVPSAAEEQDPPLQ